MLSVPSDCQMAGSPTRWMTRTPQAQAKARFVAEVSAGETSLAQVAVGLRQARTLVQGGLP